MVTPPFLEQILYLNFLLGTKGEVKGFFLSFDYFLKNNHLEIIDISKRHIWGGRLCSPSIYYHAHFPASRKRGWGKEPGKGKALSLKDANQELHILSLTSHWREFSHMTISSCKGNWKMQTILWAACGKLKTEASYFTIAKGETGIRKL